MQEDNQKQTQKKKNYQIKTIFFDEWQNEKKTKQEMNVFYLFYMFLLTFCFLERNQLRFLAVPIIVSKFFFHKCFFVL